MTKYAYVRFGLILFFSCILTLQAPAKINYEYSGASNLLSGKPTRAQIEARIQELEERVKKEPKDHVTYETIAFLYELTGQFDKQAQNLELAIRCAPKNADGLDMMYGNLARAYMILKKYELVKPVLDKALAIDPENLDNLAHVVRYYIVKEDFKNAAA
jgi:Tfp pilus assembly protein PilF